MCARAAICATASRSGRCATRSSATAITASPPRACTTIRSSGARKRIGPDLARVGGKYSNDWHYAHLSNPQALVPESLMPPYAFLAETPLRHDRHHRPPERSAHCRRALHRRGHRQRQADLLAQADPTADSRGCWHALSEGGDGRRQRRDRTELDALVAYLQMLGTMVTSPTSPPNGCSNEDGRAMLDLTYLDDYAHSILLTCRFSCWIFASPTGRAGAQAHRARTGMIPFDDDD